MAMLYSFHENFELGDEETTFELLPASTAQSHFSKGEIHLFAEKLRVPPFENQIARPRLKKLLAKSLNQFGAAIITGRAGTGKTALASEFAGEYERVAWYSIDSSERDWEAFSKYFAASFNLKHLTDDLPKVPASNLEELAYFTEVLINEVAEHVHGKRLLIVLDDVHYLFDSEWFTTFFNSLLYSLTPNIELVMLCRGTPSVPLWRLRSKQVLGVIDEKVLNFNAEESFELLERFAVPEKMRQKIHLDSFGRISKLKVLAESVGRK